MLQHLYVIRHGETAWSLTGQHTGRTDLPLTAQGEADALRLAPPLAAVTFHHVFTSPRWRARRTGELAGLGDAAAVVPDLAEWDYGDFEGLRSAEIRRAHPGWNIFRDGCPGGESAAAMTDRVDRLVLRLRSLDGNVAVFTHGHLGRCLAARWIGRPLTGAADFMLSPASIGILGYDRADPAEPVIVQWNAVV